MGLLVINIEKIGGGGEWQHLKGGGGVWGTSSLDWKHVGRDDEWVGVHHK